MTIITNKDLHYAIIMLLVLLFRMLITAIYYFAFLQDIQMFRNYLLIKLLVYLFLVYLVPIGIVTVNKYKKTINQIATKIQDTNVNIEAVHKLTLKQLYIKTLSDTLTVIVFLVIRFIKPGTYTLVFDYILNPIIFAMYILCFINTYNVRNIHEMQLESSLENG